MKRSLAESAVMIGSLIVASAAAVGAMAASDDVELTLFMVSAVATALVCFDTALEKQARSRAPWLLLSLAPAAKTVPSVYYQLREDQGLLFERYDHAGSVLFGLCVFGAVAVLSLPSRRLGPGVAQRDAVIIAGVAAVAGATGATVGYLFDARFGSATAARILETSGWTLVGGLLAGVAVAAGHPQRIPGPLAAVLTMATITAAILAVSSAGRSVELGWWALIFAGLTWSAAGFGVGALGHRAERTVLTNLPSFAAVVAGGVAAVAAISARSDRTVWSPGWAILGVLSLGLLAVGLTGRDRKVVGLDPGVDDLAATDRSARAAAAVPALDATELVEEPASPPVSKLERDVEQRRASPAHPQSVPESVPTAPVSTTSEPPVPRPAASASSIETTAPVATSRTGAQRSTASAALARARAAVESDGLQLREPDAGAHGVSPGRTEEDGAHIHDEPKQDDGAPLSTAATLREARTSAAARAADEARVALAHAQMQHTQPHHFDPSTGLLSAAGLQHLIGGLFAKPHGSGHITIVMLSIRNLNEIEATSGRVNAAAVNQEIGQRLEEVLPEGIGARFARAGFAVVLVGQAPETRETMERIGRALVALRKPVTTGTFSADIDVVAGMAQCYADEDAARFVRRANRGLERAVLTAEPSLVSMP